MSSCLITLVERRSRFLLMSRLLARDADAVEERLERMAASIPDELKKTLTWDQGSEVTDEEVARAQWLLNNRPRKVLGWKFPAEAMQEVLAEGAMIV